MLVRIILAGKDLLQVRNLLIGLIEPAARLRRLIGASGVALRFLFAKRYFILGFLNILAHFFAKGRQLGLELLLPLQLGLNLRDYALLRRCVQLKLGRVIETELIVERCRGLARLRGPRRRLRPRPLRLDLCLRSRLDVGLRGHDARHVHTLLRLRYDDSRIGIVELRPLETIDGLLNIRLGYDGQILRQIILLGLFFLLI